MKAKKTISMASANRACRNAYKLGRESVLPRSREAQEAMTECLAKILAKNYSVTWSASDEAQREDHRTVARACLAAVGIVEKAT